MNTKKIIALEFLNELEEIHKNDSLSLKIKYPQLRSLLEKVCRELTSDIALNFSDFFSSLSFVCQKYNTNKAIHGLRITANKVLHESLVPLQEDYKYHVSLFATFLKVVYSIDIPDSLLVSEKPLKEFPAIKNITLSEAKVCIVEKRGSYLICQLDPLSLKERSLEFAPEKLVAVHILEKNVNEIITSAKDFWEGALLYLIDIDIDSNEVFHPKLIILEPDYLLDVSSIAECLQDYGETELLFFKSKFESIANSKHLLLGNFANLVVDEVFSNPHVPVQFNDTFVKHFKASPFEYTTCDDISDMQNFRVYCDDSQRQFVKIKSVIENEFLKLDIDLENMSLEPSFLSNKFGLQGRMDMLDWRKGNGISKIIELKSGSTPFPDNGYSIKPNHQAQLFMYYLLYCQVNKIPVNKINSKTQGFILYSKPVIGNLRNISAYLNSFQSIIDLRNKIIAIEHLLATDSIETTGSILAMINPQNLINKKINDKFRQTIEPKFINFLQPLAGASDLERNYFISFVNYISYEHFLSKVGSADKNRENGSNGLARLWLDSFEEKKDKFEILYDLQISTNNIDQDDKVIIFKRTCSANKHVNFRVGDICVLYPRNNDADKVIDSQIFKCIIKHIDVESVTVYFRYKQRNKSFFNSFGSNGKWALESDFMENSFNSMYRNLYGFLGARQSYKNLILVQDKPAKTADYGYKNPSISHEQQMVINKALSVDHYFLLNGPPGTGKTSIIIKNIVQELIATKKNILVLAYTNRAVDELCEAINNACDNSFSRNFIRFGSKLSCNSHYHDNLLDVVLEAKEIELRASGKKFDRTEVKNVITNNNVYVSTVASIGSKDHIFKVKAFDYIIVDEASQILEPQLVGVLAKANKFILIGDHKQLPAISLQSAQRSKTNNKFLESIGLHNRKNSLFERLYKFCEDNSHVDSYDTLTYQGRMHKDISMFPNFAFYKGLLREAYNAPGLLEANKKYLLRQVDNLNFVTPISNSVGKLLSQKRLVFFNNNKVDDHYAKFNSYEADFVVHIIKEIIALYKYNNKNFDPLTTIGVIAPFRNQIALIKQKLEVAGIADSEKITVDSVERFQGSQRDIIIFSFAVNNPYQLRGMINLNDEGDVDRKLNVALTRAREQMILVGNDNILSDNLIYLRLIEHYKSKGGYIDIPLDDILAGQPVYFPEAIVSDYDEKLTQLPEPFSSVFLSRVEDLVKNDRRTKWPHKILGLDKDFTRNNLLYYGMADFDNQIDLNYQQNLDGLIDSQTFLAYYTPKENVLLYCYWNMRKNFASMYQIFNKHKEFFLPRIKNTEDRILFIDFGCGPLTASLAFNNVFKNDIDKGIHYIGIDISKTMLEKAKEFGDSHAFKFSDTFDFCTDIENSNSNYYQDNFILPHTVVITCANSLSSINIDEINKLAAFLNNLMNKYPLNNYIFVHQNPVNRDQNLNKLLEKNSRLNKLYITSNAKVSYINENQDWYATNAQFAYKIITT